VSGNDDSQSPSALWRYQLVIGVVCLAAGFLTWKAFDIQFSDKEFLQKEGQDRHLRVVSLPIHRGMIIDRNGEPLAISTPIASVWVNPKLINLRDTKLIELAKAIGMPTNRLRKLIGKNKDRVFVYLKRHVGPSIERQVLALNIAGVSLQEEFQRYYPTGEVSGHILGFNNIDDKGQEGLELAYNEFLVGKPGKERVIKDRKGRTIDVLELIEPSQPGGRLQLSLDRRLQYIAYRELKAAITRHQAKAGSLVILDVRTGEVLAAVNQPSFNPNNRSELVSNHYRNRLVTDVFEPGSTIKPFTVVAALMSNKYDAQTKIDTTPGYLRVGRETIRDTRNYGLIDLATILQKSSNVGASKIALDISKQQLWSVFNAVGFGMRTQSEFPGEVSGRLPFFESWYKVDRAILSYGYGVSVTALQLAQSYAVLGAGGEKRPVSFVYVSEPPVGEQVIPHQIARQVVAMLERAVSADGTGVRAQVAGYRVAGKTGTVRKSGKGGYLKDQHLSLFAGLVPASDPRFAMVVVVDDPQSEGYYGGIVAAPVFSKVMAAALRLLNVPPDAFVEPGLKVAGS